MPKIKPQAHWASFVPKIGPEPSLRNKYKGYKIYTIKHGVRSYSICFNQNNKPRYYNPKLKGFRKMSLDEIIIYCNKKGVRIELVADESKEIWLL